MSEERKPLRFSRGAPDEVKDFLLEVIQVCCFAAYEPEGLALDFWGNVNDDWGDEVK